METISIDPTAAEQISHMADYGKTNVEVIVDRALRTYLTQSRHQKIRVETNAFERQREALLAGYPDQYVAIHESKVIDHDLDLRTLHLRVFKQLGHTPVLLKRVTKEPERDLVFRSPHFEGEA